MNLRACLYFAFKIKDGLFIGDINSPNKKIILEQSQNSTYQNSFEINSYYHKQKERDFLISNKITCVVNCASSQIKPINHNLGIKFINFDWLDNDDQVITLFKIKLFDKLFQQVQFQSKMQNRNIKSENDINRLQKLINQFKNVKIIIDDNNDNMQLIYEFMSRAYDNCESVLVCSVRGQSRALTVITAFLMKRYQWSLYKTLEYMNSKRADFEIRATFLKQLLSYEQKLFGAKGCSRNWKGRVINKNLIQQFNILNKNQINFNISMLIDDIQQIDIEALLVRNTYVNSQIICIESRDFYMRSLASRDYTQGTRSTKLKWSTQLNIEIPHEDLSYILKKQNSNSINSNRGQNTNSSSNNNTNNTGSNQSMKNSSNWTQSNSSNQMDSIEILPIKENTFQTPKKSILKSVSAYDKNANSSNNAYQNGLQNIQTDNQQYYQQNDRNFKKKEVKKQIIQKNQSYDLIEEQNEEYEQSLSEISITKSKMKQLSPSPVKIKPLNDLEKELLAEQQSVSNDSNSSNEKVDQYQNSAIESDYIRENRNQIGNDTNNKFNAKADSDQQSQKDTSLKQKDKSEIKIFQQNTDRIQKNQNPPSVAQQQIQTQMQRQDFQLQKEKKKNNYFQEENNKLQKEDLKCAQPQLATNSNMPQNLVIVKNSNKNINEEVRICTIEENENNENLPSEAYKLNYQITDNNDKKYNFPPKSGGGYQILNEQQIKNNINLAQYQISNRQTQSQVVSQPVSNSSSRQTTPTRKYRKSPFPMALPQRKLVQSQTTSSSKENSRKNSLSSVEQIIQSTSLQPQQSSTIEKRQNAIKQIVNKSPDSSSLQLNINLNINSVNILNQTTNPLYSRQKSPPENDPQNLSILQSSNQNKNGRKISRPPSETKKRQNTEKVYTEGNQAKELDFLKPSSTRLTRRLQTYTNGDPITFLPNITFMRQRTPLKNNINLPNTQNIPQKQQKNLEISFQDITTTPNKNVNPAYLQPIINQNSNNSQMYTNYLNDVDITSQQNTAKSNATNKHTNFKRDNTSILKSKVSAPSPYQNYENRSNSTFDQRRVSIDFGGGRGTDFGKQKRSVSRGREKDMNNTFTYLNTSNNNTLNNTVSNTPNNNNQAYNKKGGFKPTYNKLLY